MHATAAVLPARLPIPNDGANGSARFFSEGSFEKLQSLMSLKPIAKGAALFWEGAPADKLIFVRSGRIHITKTSDSGRQMTLYLLREGDLYGEPSPFAKPTHAFNAEVAEDGEIGLIRMADLEALLRRHGDLAIEFMKWMGLMHRTTQAKFRDLMLYGKAGALGSLLIRSSNADGMPDEGGIRLRLKLSNAELADMIGATRECVNRLLADWRRIGVIDMKEGHIVIRDMDYLRAACRCDNCPKELCRL